jgi:putative hydrolase of the HAD superfamily
MTRERAWWLAGGFLRRRDAAAQFPYTTTMSLIPDEVRVVYFDAVGTLIFPDPPVAEAYHAVGRQYGSRLTVDEVRTRFYAAFAAQEKVDLTLGNRTDPARELQRWRHIVTDTLPDVLDSDAAFDALYEHFAAPGSWRVAPEALRTLAGLKDRHLTLGIGSNFDDRLSQIIAGMPDLNALIDELLVSSIFGWRKPAPEFFKAMCHIYSPNQVLMVGDDRVNDYDGARAAGLHAFLVDETTTLTDLLS